jgi:hypothetical protein
MNMLASCLAKEEPEVITIAIRPGKDPKKALVKRFNGKNEGVVETQMQETIRKPENAEPMTEGFHSFFTSSCKCNHFSISVVFLNMSFILDENGTLLKPEVPSSVIANLVLKAPSAFSGQFYSWDNELLSSYRE